MNYKELKERLHPGKDIPAIIGRDHLFCSAVIVPLIETKEGPSLLFQKRAAQIRQGGEICFPGGKFDPVIDSDYRATAVRESCEEIGVSPEDIEILGSPGTLVTPMSVLVHTYLGTLPENIDFHPNPEEVEELFTIALDWFKNNPPEEYSIPLQAHPWEKNEQSDSITHHFPVEDLKLPEKYRNPWGTEHKIWSYSSSRGAIWGITAQILNEVLPLLFGCNGMEK